MEACRHYMGYVQLHGCLLWGDGKKAESLGSRVQGPETSERQSASADSAFTIPLITLDLSPTVPPASGLFTPGSFLFSYTMSAIIVGIGLLIGVTWKMSSDRQAAQTSC